jgi:hypothetical protein
MVVVVAEVEEAVVVEI